MVQPNTRIYPTVFLTRKVYKNWEKHMSVLAKRTKTEIIYDFAEQCFVITGRSQQACDDSAKKIEQQLLPNLNKALDDHKFLGTFESLEEIRENAADMLANLSIRTNTNNSPPSCRSSARIGRPLNLDEIEKKHAEKNSSSSGSTEREAYYDYETESDEPEESDEEFVETFTFAKNIQNPKEVLTGRPSDNSKPPDYLRIIGNDTDTECSLQGRDIKIVGSCEETIQEAKERFKNLQTAFKRSKRPTEVVPCMHYPAESSPFSLFFCSLERYAYRNFVAVPENLHDPLYVMLPVFKDKFGNEAKPRDMLAVKPQVAPPPQWVIQQQQAQQAAAQQQQMSLDERMKMAYLEHKKDYSNYNAGMAPDHTPLWGENKNYVVRKNIASPSAQAPVGQVAKPVQQEEYPSLSRPAATPPTKKPQQQTKRRVIRITGQKSSHLRSPASPARSHSEIVRDYNLYNIKTALQDGLNGVRGFKGNVKLSAKIGKILWTKIDPTNAKKIWDFHDIKDIAVKEKGIKPCFNGITTFSDEVIESMSNVLPEPYGRSANFEIYANARNQPSVEYKPVVMHMSQGVVELKRVVSKRTTITEIDWVSLERKFDFQLALKTEELARLDVKPFSTFIRKVAVDPNTRVITYENVPDFLQVTHILLRQITKYRIHFPFVIEITRVEKIPIAPQKYSGFGIEKMLGDTGKGQVHYELEVTYSTHDEIFKSNVDLPVGKLARWKVEDVLESEQDSALVEYIRCLLILVEKFEAIE